MEFIVYTNTEWDGPPRARHQLSHALAKRFKVTFVAANTIGLPGLKCEKVNGNFELLTPSFPSSFRLRYRMPGLNEAYQLWLYEKLKKHFEGKEVVFICTDFGGYLVGKYFDKFIYMANDDFINNVKVPGWMKAYTTFTQSRLVKTATFNLATAQKLVNDFAEINPKSYELPLGAPEFSKVDITQLSLNREDEKVKVVLLGFIDKKKTPLVLINKILEIENVELHLIGPIKDDFLNHLSKEEKVKAHGVLTGDPLSSKLSEMDVAIAPYYMDDPNTGRTPNKLWQYLATGIPAVITNLPNVRHWEFPEKTVYKANNDDEFVSFIKQAYKDNTIELMKERISIAANNSWSKRVDQLLAYIKELY
ncbi:glycosyltransferase [Cyclobacterium marinum]|nr:glycosyltransferase [Cyclobacterium marinum]MBR9777026.1 glycosyltransferase family 4 protein [Cytophagales bacterium]|tara:strand:- start:54760 stop:55848 length:1089 start_codon:yes stop_codon:yes gene_type:complete